MEAALTYLHRHSLLPPAAAVDLGVVALVAKHPHGDILHALADRLLGGHGEVEAVLLAVECLLPGSPARGLQCAEPLISGPVANFKMVTYVCICSWIA